MHIKHIQCRIQCSSELWCVLIREPVLRRKNECMSILNNTYNSSPRAATKQLPRRFQNISTCTKLLHLIYMLINGITHRLLTKHTMIFCVHRLHASFRLKCTRHNSMWWLSNDLKFSNEGIDHSQIKAFGTNVEAFLIPCYLEMNVTNAVPKLLGRTVPHN